MLRAQLFSVDFMFAVVALSLAIGIALQTLDLTQKQNAASLQLQTNNAEIIAQQFINSSSSFAPPTAYCYRYSNGTNNCTALVCPKSTFIAKRLLNCSGTVCSLEVRTCE